MQWDLLEEYADVDAFDAIREFTDDLARRDARPNRHYYAMALGNEDGRRKFFVKPDLAASLALLLPRTTELATSQMGKISLPILS